MLNDPEIKPTPSTRRRQKPEQYQELHFTKKRGPKKKQQSIQENQENQEKNTKKNQKMTKK